MWLVVWVVLGKLEVRRARANVGKKSVYLSQGENDIDFVCKLRVMMSEHLTEDLTQQIIIFLEQSLVNFKSK